MDLTTENPAALEWQAARDTAAAEHLATLPGRDLLAKRIEHNVLDLRRSPLRRRADRWFQSVVLDPNLEHPVVVVRSAPAGEPRVLVDSNELAAKRGMPVALDWYEPSPDGSLLAYSVSVAGTEISELNVLDVQTGDKVPDEVPWSCNSNVSWLPDSTGFWGIDRKVEDSGMTISVHCHSIGRPPEAPIDIPAGLLFPNPVVSKDGRHVALVSGNTEMRMDWVIRDGQTLPLLKDVPGCAVGEFIDDDLIAMVDGDAPRGRVVRIPVLTASDKSTWTELVPETKDVLRTVAVVDDTIVVGYLRDAACRLRLLNLDGTIRGEVDLPGDGVISTYSAGATHPAVSMFATGEGEISFLYSTFDAAPAIYRYVIAEERLEVVLPPALQIEGLTVSLITGTSADGTKVPAHVVHRSDLDLSIPQPTVIYGYGGFNLGYVPSFLGVDAAWVDAGGVYVLAHLRGGSEFGSEWWQGGRRDQKQHTFDDLFAVAEVLIDSGLTTSRQLAFKGESNGGLLAGAAISQRPDLWAAVVGDVGIYDLIGMERDPLTYAIGAMEYGDPRIPAEADWLRAISPVERVGPTEYPAILITAGANDPRCPAWQSRVFVDKLEQAQRGEAPILLRVYTGQGHGPAGTAALASKEADWQAFVAEATGLKL